MSFSLGNSNMPSLDAYATWLSVVLKDHKSAEAIALSRESYKSVVREEVSQQGLFIYFLTFIQRWQFLYIYIYTYTHNWLKNSMCTELYIYTCMLIHVN